MTHSKLVIPWNSPWQAKNNEALKKLSSILRKQLDAAANGSVISHIPGVRRYDPKMKARRVRQPRGKIHLRRPNETKSMCGSISDPARVRDRIDEVTCDYCVKRYANNSVWYQEQIRKEHEPATCISDKG